MLCGDFNLPPGTAPYRLVADRLRDVASDEYEALYTFISTRPFARIDHIFVIRSFRRTNAPQSSATILPESHQTIFRSSRSFASSNPCRHGGSLSLCPWHRKAQATRDEPEPKLRLRLPRFRSILQAENGPWLSLVERLNGVQEVVGSNPAGPISVKADKERRSG